MGMFEFNLLVMLVTPILVTCVVDYLVLFYLGGHTSLMFSTDNIKDNSSYFLLAAVVAPLMMLVYWYFMVDKELVASACFFYWFVELVLSLGICGLLSVNYTEALVGVRNKHTKQQKDYNFDFNDVEVGQYVVNTYVDGLAYLNIRKCQLETDVSGTYKVLVTEYSAHKDTRWSKDEITEHVRNYLLTSDTYLINIDGSLEPVTKKPKTITIC